MGIMERALRKLPLVAKILFLVSGAALFFILFPFLLGFGTPVYFFFCALLAGTGIVFYFVAGRRMFKITIWLWATGSVIYFCIAAVLILKGIQPLPYMQMNDLNRILYYFSYPLRVLGIFFIGLIFSRITSPAEFLRWGEAGLKIALAYRAFEYSVNSFDDVRQALLIQGEWPDFRKRGRVFAKVILAIRGAPVLVATTFRNIILWFPWAWICYNKLRHDLRRGGLL